MRISRGKFLLVLAVSGALGMVGNPLPAAEKAVALIRSAQSGTWSAVATWEGGQVPGAGARVQIREGHAVVYDLKSEQPIRLIHVAGTLTFVGVSGRWASQSNPSSLASSPA